MPDRYDLVIRNGLILDGSGAEPYQGDVAIRDGKIVAVGAVEDHGAREIDATGKCVTPGFIDIHTHYDGQATWESRLIPSSNHGVTTVVTGNCGVGFAPCRADDRAMLVELMEGVEDVPEVVMTAGLPWTWESFPDYLDVLASRRYDVDIAAMLPHSCLRVYVMGERGAALEPAADDDLPRFRALVSEAMAAGAIGVGTSRTMFHRFPDGRAIPSKDVGAAELRAIMGGISDWGRGVFQAVFDLEDLESEFALLRDVCGEAGVPFSFTLLQTLRRPEAWKRALALLAETREVRARAQVIGRPTGLLLGLDLSWHPFSMYPSYDVIAHLPLSERLAEMRKPEVRTRILADSPADLRHPLMHYLTAFAHTFVLGNPPNYEPDPATSIQARAERTGVSPQEVAYDLLLENDGCSVLFIAGVNYVDGDLEAVRTMMLDPHTVLGLGDGGAHYGIICDAGAPTFMLTYWARDRATGPKLPLPWLIEQMTRVPAETVGLKDRGMLAPGLRADVNIIDLDRLALGPPVVEFDLPAQGRRIKQAARGYAATIVAGEPTYLDGKPTGALPGRLVRSHAN